MHGPKPDTVRCLFQSTQGFGGAQDTLISVPQTASMMEGMRSISCCQVEQARLALYPFYCGWTIVAMLQWRNTCDENFSIVPAQVLTGTGPMQQYANALSVPYGVTFWATIFLATAHLISGLSTGESLRKLPATFLSRAHASGLRGGALAQPVAV